MSVSRVWIGLAAAGVLAAACSDPVGVRQGREEPGVLQLVGGAALAAGDTAVRWSMQPGEDVLTPRRVLVVPDTVAAGVSFDAHVYTIGMNGCWRAGGQEVVPGQRVIELKPTDVHSGAEICTEVLMELPHRSSLVIATPGDWVVRVRGRRVIHGEATWEEPVVAERTVVVR